MIVIEDTEYENMLRYYKRKLEEDVYIFIHHGHNLDGNELDLNIARQNKYCGCIFLLEELKKNYWKK